MINFPAATRILALAATLIWPAVCFGGTVSVQEYRAQLQAADKDLKPMEKQDSPPLDLELKKLAITQDVRRSDGTTISVPADQWSRPQPGGSSSWTKKDAAALRSTLQERMRALDAWEANANGTQYNAADAQEIVGQLVGSGQISVEPTIWQRMQALYMRAMEAFGKALKGFLDWLASIFPKRSFTPPSMQVSPGLLRLFYVMAILSLLGVLGWLMWKAVGGRWTRGGARREVRFVGEDAELLALPPDELSARARNFARQGNYPEALRHLYIALLLEMDAVGVWRYDSRRTNWEHINALRKEKDGRGVKLVPPLGDLTRRFDRVRYGNAPCNEEDWLRFERDTTSLRESAKSTHSGATAGKSDEAGHTGAVTATR